MADIDLKTETPDTSLPTTGFLFGADSQAASAPSVFTTQAVATTLLGSTTLSGATITASQPVLDLSQTWNNGATTFTGIKYNVTNTASATLSRLLSLGTAAGGELAGVVKDGSMFADLGIWKSAAQSYNGTNFYGIGFVSGNIDFYTSGSWIASWTSSRCTFSVPISLSAGGAPNSPDTFLSRRAAANLRLGAADAAAPVAQTLSVQSVVAGTSNTAGANLTITGSQGTGTGAGGSIIFQVAPAGSSGTAQNALATALTIDGGGSTLIFGAGGRILTNGGSVYFNTPGNPYYFLDSGGSSIANPVSSYAWMGIGSTGVVLRNTMFLGFSSTGDTNVGTGGDVRLYRDTTGILALRNGANAQAFNVYNTFTDASNYERGKISWSSNVLQIGTEKAGTGTARALELQTDGTTRLTISTAGQLLVGSGAVGAPSISFSDSTSTGIWSTGTGNISFSTAGTERYRMGSGGRFAAAGEIAFGQSTAIPFSIMSSGAYGVVAFTPGSGTDTRLCLGGTTSSFPAIKRSSTTLQARLADDSAFAGFASANMQAATAYTVATLPGTPGTGMIARVTDALAPTIGATVTGGGAAYALVNYNGANWTVIGV